MVLGVGAGWLAEEFAALGVPFDDRGRRLDEYVAVMRALWSEDKASFDGEFFRFADCISRPRPVHGTIPVVVGGHTKAAARRAGRLGDGFFPGNASIEDIVGLIAVMRGAAIEAGRDPDAIEVIAGAGAPPGDALYTRVQQLADVGVRQAIVPTFPAEVLTGVGEDLVARFG
jgi:alkanesulfonate monooxygenase SsuD/methylene tetrahydromethanopterin reductase-like flavin-dependent oxidoreductase (luciferase family)